jgi:chromosome segregation ATPase
MQHGAVSRFRLFLIAACLATAAASALSGFRLSVRVALVGAALVAAVLLLAIRRNSVEVRAAEASAPESGREQESRAPDERASTSRRLFRRPDTGALDARISAIAGQLEEYERKLREMSVAHAAADLARRQELDSVRQQLADLQAVNEEQRATIASLQQQHARRLARLQNTMTGQREALAGLESALETALATTPDSLAATGATDSTP